jgi:hypothetical protein
LTGDQNGVMLPIQIEKIPEKKVKEDYPVLYVIVRTDMVSMTPGKAQAHSGHAANAFMQANYIFPLTHHQEIHPLVEAWMASTPQGFGTQINLKAPWAAACAAGEKVIAAGNVAMQVADPTYPYEVNEEIVGLIHGDKHTDTPVRLANGNWLCFRHEVTAIYFFGLKSELSPVLGEFPLHP